jgi:transcriptional regulator with XRE-family HTH domain
VKLPRLRATRERRALSQRELADMAGVSRTTIVSLEQGADSPFPSTIRKLARALGVAPDELMEPEATPGQVMAALAS